MGQWLHRHAVAPCRNGCNHSGIAECCHSPVGKYHNLYYTRTLVAVRHAKYQNDLHVWMYVHSLFRLQACLTSGGTAATWPVSVMLVCTTTASIQLPGAQVAIKHPPPPPQKSNKSRMKQVVLAAHRRKMCLKAYFAFNCS